MARKWGKRFFLLSSYITFGTLSNSYESKTTSCQREDGEEQQLKDLFAFLNSKSSKK